MERLTKYIDGYAHGAEGINAQNLTGAYCRGSFEATACVERLAEYEDLEKRGKLLKLPCAVGDTVYVIPSKTNYKLNILNKHSENNRVYEQVVNRIEISGNGYLLVTCDGMASVINTFYKKTWFLKRNEAETALAIREKRMNDMQGNVYNA